MTGVDPKDQEHGDYLKKLADDFVEIMSSMINKAVMEKAKTEDLLVNEIFQHISFCQNKCRDFHGRDNMLKVCFCILKNLAGVCEWDRKICPEGLSLASRG